MVELADWRVIFATPGTPPKRVRGVQLAPDEQRPGWLVFTGPDGQTVFAAPSEFVLFASRIIPEDDGGGDGEAARPGPLGAVPGPAQVAQSIRPRRLA